MDELHLHDLVALTSPIPEYTLRLGAIAAIDPNGEYLLEFVGKEVFLTLCQCFGSPN